MFTALRTFITRWLTRQNLPSPASGITSDLAGVVSQPSRMASSSIRGGGGEGAQSPQAELYHTDDSAHPESVEGAPHLVPYDENLLERARTQWQFGDWESLAKLDRNTLQQHPDRAKLALLAAAGHLQQGDTQSARQFTRLAQDWGCSKKLVSQILIAGVHNTLGRAVAITGQQTRALKHFESSIDIGTPGSEVRLMTQARVGEQLAQLGLHTSNSRLQINVAASTAILASPTMSHAEPTLEETASNLPELQPVPDKKLPDALVEDFLSPDDSLREIALKELAIVLDSFLSINQSVPYKKLPDTFVEDFLSADSYGAKLPKT